MDKLARLYVNEVTSLHGIPILIVSDQDPRLSLQQSLGTKLNLSTALHHRMNGQSEITI